jgi:hypothetical protein
MKKSNYHSFYLNEIKRQSGASFVGYEQYKNDFKLKVIVDNVPQYFALTGTPQDVTPERYNELLRALR